MDALLQGVEVEPVPVLRVHEDDLSVDGHVVGEALDDGGDELLAEPDEEAGEHLRALLERLNNGRERALRPGLLAVWKPGLKNRRFPRYGEPVVVVDEYQEKYEPVISVNFRKEGNN